MCGITGFIDISCERQGKELRSIIDRMTSVLNHRGPDDQDLWVDAAAGVALGHRRLSILDLSPAGRQPMHSACGRYVVVFNGELYNHGEIRRELESLHGATRLQWRGHSDTEVLLAACAHWGLEKAVPRFTGMFAFALWDRQERVLHLVRDRIGEKPLYYGRVGTVFFFGSELKALLVNRAVRMQIDRNALALFFRHSCIPAPYSIYRNVFKLLPGTMLSIPLKILGGDAERLLRPRAYWSVREVAERGVDATFGGTDADAVAHLDGLLKASVKQQMVADVPLGAFLSGGIDSSTVVALMQTQSERPVRSFTIGFHEQDYNEARFAREVARHLGTDHTELYVTADDALSVIPLLPEIYDEPFSDVSQIPTYLIAKLTRKHVTVSLSGDAGDELFGGYNRYLWGDTLWRSTGWMPRPMKAFAAALVRMVRPGSWDRFFGAAGPVLPKRLRQRNVGDKVQKLAEALSARTPVDLYRRLASHWTEPSSIVLNSAEPVTVLTDRTAWADIEGFPERMMYLDLMTYLPDDILVKVDRAAMSVGLETRIPFLDPRVMEFAWTLPLSMKIRGGQGKWLLRQVLYQYVPRELIERPKAGFAVPMDSWLRGPLRDWAEGLLDERKLRDAGYLDPIPIRKRWREHLSRKRNWQYPLWDVLMFQSWFDHQSRFCS